MHMQHAANQGARSGSLRRARLGWTFFVVLASAFVVGGCSQFRVMRDSAALTQRWEGVASPDFSFKTLDGEVVGRDALLGKRALFLFWAPWCAVCRHEIPTLNQLVAEKAADDVMLYAISFEDEASVREFLAAEPIAARTAVVADGALPAPFDLVPAFPAWFVLDRQGRFERVRFGYQGEGGMREMLTGK